MQLIQRACIAVVALTVMWSCKDNEDFTNGEIVFNLSHEGEPANGELVTFSYGETIQLGLYARYAPEIEITKPTGWDCSVSVANEECIITAPAVSEFPGSQTSGDITFDITSRSGKKLSASVKVAIVEGGIVFVFDDAGTTADIQEFAAAEKKTYTFISENVSQLDIAAPKGWTVDYTGGDTELSITAPATGDTSAELSGTVSVTPKSPAGASGLKQEISVIMSASKPSVTFDKDTYVFPFGAASSVIPFTAEHVATAEVLSKPQGWELDVDPAGTLTVSSPAKTATEADGIGVVSMEFKNTEGISTRHEITVSLKGIATAAQFIAFRDAYAQDNPLTDYLVDGELLFVGDIDLSGYDDALFVPKKGDAGFEYPINGWNRTIKLGITSSASATGLFHTLEATASVTDLVIGGTIALNGDNTNMKAAGVAVYNNGADFTNVTGNVDFTYTPGTAGKIPSGTQYGGLVANTKKAVYAGCTANGRIHMNNGSLRIVGGIVGIVDEKDGNPGGTFNDCMNNGAMDLEFKTGDGANCHFGGIVANSEHAMSVYNRCTNNGDITIQIGKKDGTIWSCGGIVGVTIGFLTDCLNTGDITATEGGAKTRRYGGIAGAMVSDKGKVEATRCVNRGNISHTSNFVGGCFGLMEKSVSYTFIECKNYGTISNPNAANPVETFGGVIGALLHSTPKTVIGCENHGKLSGYANGFAAGVIGRLHQGPATIKDCINTGEITPVTIQNQTKKLICAGIAAIDEANAGTASSFENCSNTGALKPTVNVSGVTRNVWVYKLTVTSAEAVPPTDPTQADPSTAADQLVTQYINETLLETEP